jgi:hypothetical protein
MFPLDDFIEEPNLSSRLVPVSQWFYFLDKTENKNSWVVLKGVGWFEIW